MIERLGPSLALLERQITVNVVHPKWIRFVQLVAFVRWCMLNTFWTYKPFVFLNIQETRVENRRLSSLGFWKRYALKSLLSVISALYEKFVFIEK